MIRPKAHVVTPLGRGARLIAALAGLVLCQAWLQPAAAQDAAGGGAGDVETERLDALVETLEDETQRRQFIDRLEALIAARRAIESREAADRTLGARLLSMLSARVDAVGAQLTQAAAVVEAIPQTVARVATRAEDPAARERWLEVAAKLVLVLVVAWLARWLARRLLAPAHAALAVRNAEGPVEAVLMFAGRAVLAVLPVAAYAAAALIVLPLTEPRPTTRILALGLVNAVVLVQAAMVAARLVFENGGARTGLLGVRAETGAYLVIWTRRLAVVGAFGYVLAETALLLGLAAGAHAVLLKLVGLVVAAMLVVLVLQNRRGVAAALAGAAAGGEGRDLRSRLTGLWHIPVLLYILVAYGAWLMQSGNGFAFLARATLSSAALVVIAVVALKAIRLVFERGFRVSADLARRFPGLEARANRYVGIVRVVLVTLTFVVAALLLVEIWIGGSLAWLSGESGRVLVARVLAIALVVIAAVAALEIVTSVIERLLSATDGDSPGSRGARMRTLLPMIRNAMRVVIGAIVVLTVLSELGIDIGPLLAGAGIAGLAIGFGAQSLVKDVITGVFILVEDSIAVGDVVDLGGHAGVVEAMTVRTVRLRDLSGSVHVVPFGEVASVLNMTKDFAFALMDIGVAYKEDVDRVIEVLKGIGDEMRDDPEYGAVILEPLEVLGLDSFGDSAVVIRIRLKTLPIKQWWVRREFYRRMKRRFDDLGIEIPFPHRTIFYGDAGAPRLDAPAASGSPAGG